MSLDGFVAGPSQSLEHPLRIGGMRLHEWVFPLAIWRSMHGLEGGEQFLAAGLVDEMAINLVPTLIGSGERLFAGDDDDLHGLALVRTVAAPAVIHLKFAK